MASKPRGALRLPHRCVLFSRGYPWPLIVSEPQYQHPVQAGRAEQSERGEESVTDGSGARRRQEAERGARGWRGARLIAPSQDHATLLHSAAGPRQSHQPHPRPGDPESRGQGLRLLHSVSEIHNTSQDALPDGTGKGKMAPRSLPPRGQHSGGQPPKSPTQQLTLTCPFRFLVGSVCVGVGGSAIVLGENRKPRGNQTEGKTGPGVAGGILVFRVNVSDAKGSTDTLQSLSTRSASFRASRV